MIAGKVSVLVELEKQSFCDLKVINNTEHHVAFKVKTTSPKKYFVRPNTGVVQPWDSCIIRGAACFFFTNLMELISPCDSCSGSAVTLQAQREAPPDMQCKDKFLLQSTIVPPNTDVDDLPPDTFNKDSGKTIEECKLRVVYVPPSSAQGNLEDEGLVSATRSPDANSALQRLKDERDAAVRQTQLLQQDLDMLKRRGQRKGVHGFSLMFAAFVGLIGIMVGLILNLLLSSPPPTVPQND
ncbi:Vesicle-associated protein 2-1 [Citrus sinensis]|uniref:Vesicle-associated protein 2-1 n=1 Tax=Citrus sinensis TaxID=2711 RepID=A0ACB8LUY2_CITSI|nr:Vesicle-associated protein 2-1 [Citrus sinensis]